MPPPILVTKLFIPPTRPELVPRAGLVQRLNDGQHRKLTIISAPAGFGKTTLVGEWIQALEENAPHIAIAWLSLDEGDNDIVRFLTYFSTALNQAKGINDSFGKGALSALQSP
jgi:LuxR family transcriptional regulator, maltose regulon positive regulatory protein